MSERIWGMKSDASRMRTVILQELVREMKNATFCESENENREVEIKDPFRLKTFSPFFIPPAKFYIWWVKEFEEWRMTLTKWELSSFRNLLLIYGRYHHRELQNENRGLGIKIFLSRKIILFAFFIPLRILSSLLNAFW